MYITQRYYGCCKCQAYHFTNETAYTDHLVYQSKHGIREERVWVQMYMRNGNGTCNHWYMVTDAIALDYLKSENRDINVTLAAVHDTPF